MMEMPSTEHLSEEFSRFLASAPETFGENLPMTRGFVESLRTRNEQLSRGGPGVTAQTLIPDLVSAFSYVEARLAELEKRIDETR